MGGEIGGGQERNKQECKNHGPCMVPVNLLDNLLRPLVMGRGLKTPILVILIGVIGGTLAYGITGLFLGPIVLAVIWELMVAWIREQDTE